ncbi:MAG: DNA mismatch repair endonuclease MutL [Chlorobiota bacterium]
MEEQRIWILPDFLVSQIAAGEVVQRPESVVKELVENALDAGATTIAVTVHGGGKRLIHVVDNGCGMSRPDLLLCIQRHATSKLRSLEDLHRIRTLGFRGEALASIAAVSQLEIRTRRAEDAVGWRLLSEPEGEPRVEPYACEKGTQVFVRNLFYNVPARRKFLRSDITEFRLIADMMTRFVLGQPDVRFVFNDERTLLFDVPPGMLQERFAALFGDELAQRMLPVECCVEGLRIWGLIGHPEVSRPSRTHQFLFLNRRWIRHKGLSHAVYTAYEQLLDAGSYPVFVLHIEVDPEEVDVNVHPQKYEVRFEDEQRAFTAMLEAVQGTLRQYHLAPTVAVEFAHAPMTVERTREGEQLLVNRLTGEIVAPARPGLRQESVGGGRGERISAGGGAARHILNRIPAGAELASGLLAPTPAVRCWQIRRTYILWETAEGLRLVDQHVAHERVLYERFRQAWEVEQRLPQRLLLPLPIALSPAERALVEELWESLHAMGFELQRLPSGDYELTAAPADLPSGQEEQTLRELLAAYQEQRPSIAGSVVEWLLATMACKAAVKAGDLLTEAEMQALLQQLQECRLPYVCPHGRPVIVELPWEEVERLFERR